jgi:DNA-binding PadR family transcriptional regulator
MPGDLRDGILSVLSAEPDGLRAPELASRLPGRVSQPTLWRALDQLRNAGLVIVEGRARATRYHALVDLDRSALRSLRMHQIVARRIAADPALRSVAIDRLEQLRRVNPHGQPYHERWAALLEGPLPRLLRTLNEVSEQADALRQESPFTVLVPAVERRRVFDSIGTR